MTEQTQNIRGVIGEFANPGELLHAAEKLRDAGMKGFDCHSPFPIHGMDDAMGLSRSPLAIVVAVISFFAVLGGLFMQFWMNAVDYPLVISGKPLVSYQAYAPVGFGLAVLTAAFAAFIGMLVVNKLPQLYHWVFYSKNFHRVTDDGFFVTVEAEKEDFDAAKTVSFLMEIGASSVEVIETS